MKVSLRILQGQFQKASGERADEIAVRKEMYFIGSDASCNLRCPLRSISPRHCTLLTDGDYVSVHDLNSETGVFLNDHQIQGSALLKNGDLLRVGTLEFELVIEGVTREPLEENPAELDEAAGGRWRGAPDQLRPTPPPEDIDKMDGDITEMLQREDESARKHRLTHPDTLRYDTAELKAVNRQLIEAEREREQLIQEQAETAKAKKQRPLPKSKKVVVSGSDATEAAKNMLGKVFKSGR